MCKPARALSTAVEPGGSTERTLFSSSPPSSSLSRRARLELVRAMLVWAAISLVCLARALAAPLDDQLAFLSSSSPPLSDPATLPRNRPAWFDPRERGGALLNVRQRASPRLSHPMLTYRSCSPACNAPARLPTATAQSLGRPRAAQHHHLRAIQSRHRRQRGRLHCVLEVAGCVQRSARRRYGASQTPCLTLRTQGGALTLISAGLWNECANMHIGDPQVADLGDGKGQSGATVLAAYCLCSPRVCFN